MAVEPPCRLHTCSCATPPLVYHAGRTERSRMGYGATNGRGPVTLAGNVLARRGCLPSNPADRVEDWTRVHRVWMVAPGDELIGDLFELRGSHPAPPDGLLAGGATHAD